MSEHSNEMEGLIQLSKIDGDIQEVREKIKKIEETLKEKEANLNSESAKFNVVKSEYERERQQLEKEERILQEEQDRLVARRKTISTVNDYKLQQKVEKEIEFANKQSGEREDLILQRFEELEKKASELEKIEKEIEGLRGDFEEFQRSSEQELASYHSQIESLEGKRNQLASSIDREMLKEYERISQKYPGTALVAVVENHCSGCYMAVGPQELVVIARGGRLVRCRGCGRGLYLLSEA